MLTALVVKKEGISCEYKLKYKLITLRTSCYLTNFKMSFFCWSYELTHRRIDTGIPHTVLCYT